MNIVKQKSHSIVFLTILSLMIILSFSAVSVAEEPSENVASTLDVETPSSQPLMRNGEINFTPNDVVLQLDLNKLSSENEAEKFLHISDFYDLNKKAISYVTDNFSEDEITSTAAFLYLLKAENISSLKDISENTSSRLKAAIVEKGYSAADVNLDKVEELLSFYQDIRKERIDKKEKIVNELYDNMDVLGYIKFDQEGRSCANKDSRIELLCLNAQDGLLNALKNQDYQDSCRMTSTKALMTMVSVDEAEYSNAYHRVLDHKTIKFIVDAEDYEREKLRSYMDGALMKMYEDGYSPGDEMKMKVAQSVRPQIMKLCVSLLKNYKADGTRKSK